MSSKATEQIKERLPIQDVIGSYIKLDRAGANFKGKCPFHNEKTPSFMVSPDRGSYYCFGCGAKGDVFTFVQEFEKLDFKDALKLLADRAGVVLDTYKDPEAKKDDDEKDRLRKIMEHATSFFEDALKDDDASLEYLRGRGLEDKTIHEWRLGSTKKGWNNLYDHLKSLEYKDEEIEKAGLAKKGNHGFYDRFRSRIMFPIFDQAGKVIAFTGRFKDWEKDPAPTDGKEEIIQAKYLNSPDTILFDKSRTLYGFHKAKSNISKWKFSLLVEGQMDLLMCHQAGFDNAIATSGTALTMPQLEMMMRFSKNVMIAYDGDKAGVEAARRAWTLALSLSMDVKVALMPHGVDPADIIVKDPNTFKEILKKGTHIVEFYLNALIARGLQGRELGKAIESELLPYVKAIESPIDQAHFIAVISSRSGIKEDVLNASLTKVGGSAPLPAALPNAVSDDTIPPQNNSSTNRLIAGTYLLLKDEENAKKYIENAVEIKDELMFPVEEWLSHNKESPEAYLTEILSKVERKKLQDRLEELMRKSEEGNQDEIRDITKKLASFK